MNKVLSKREYLKISNYICSILRGLPEIQHLAYKNTEKPLYRGVPNDCVNLEQYQVGSRLFWPAFTSTSKDIKVSKSFIGETGVLFVITVGENQPYTNIELPSDWSYFPVQNEVVLLPNFNFRVTKVEEEKD